MTGQVDVGWSVVPLGLQDAASGKIHIIARAREATELQNQTIRVNLANVESLKTKRAAIVKFMQVYAKAIEWGYSDPKAIDIFSQNMKVPRDIAKKGVDEYYPKSAMQIGEIKDLERSLKDALDYKFIPSPKTPADIKGLFDIVYKPPG
jgi:NitT/TauT family transport system substrate-binding protein